MEAVRVELDGELVLRPTGVDEAAARGPVRDGQGQVRLGEDLEEAVLHDAEREVDVAVQHETERRGACAARTPREHALDVTRCRPVADPCLMAGAGETVLVEQRGDVDERASGGGDGDAAVVPPVVPGGAAGADRPRPLRCGARSR